MRTYKLSYLFLLLVWTSVFSQDLNKIGKKDMVTVNGGLNLNSIVLATNNPSSTRSPFSWYASGNVTVGFIGWSFPLVYSISNQSRTFSQPFNQIAINPTYKWVKIYTGWTNLQLSPYTLSGYPFLGGGIDLSPKHWKITAFYGQFKKAVNYDPVKESAQNMSYQRLGYGGRLGYEKNGFSVNGIFFKAYDLQNSLLYLPSNNTLFPQEGVVSSLGFKLPVFKQFHLEGEYAQSKLTRNSFSEDKNTSLVANEFFTIKNTQTTSKFLAYKASATYSGKILSLGLSFERVDPGYATLGAYYFNNDLQNITLSPQLKLMKGKLNIGLNSGIQKNNLDGTKQNTTSRIIGSGNISFVPTSQWIINANYSNFTNYTRQRPNNNPFYNASATDTMYFYQVSQNASALVSYSFKRKEYRNSITLNGSQVISSLLQNNHEQPKTYMTNVNVSYALMHLSKKHTLNITFNANEAKTPFATSQFFGPGIHLGKPFYKDQLKFSAGSIVNTSYTNSKSSGLVFSERLSVQYTPKIKDSKYGKPSFSLNCNYVNKPAVVSGGMNLSEFTANINLNYGF